MKIFVFENHVLKTPLYIIPQVVDKSASIIPTSEVKDLNKKLVLDESLRIHDAGFLCLPQGPSIEHLQWSFLIHGFPEKMMSLIRFSVFFGARNWVNRLDLDEISGNPASKFDFGPSRPTL